MAHIHHLHIMPQSVGWKIVKTMASEPLALTRTREEALALAMRMQFEDPDAGDILVHGCDGGILQRTTIKRSDLFPSRKEWHA